ncbi:hypothetical protein QTH90_20935 [Variovorax sp. J2P1-59]|uniref:hypothetical protein n=1 Tax=Variovorax flavidus TaxID=3053501 RepID=UPI0025790AE6|nr:hypothetical protein [Variovorax sp. J2P1-59]MDM0076887.1 hypothetical protein [Variovorax sp. J2P1-59]
MLNSLTEEIRMNDPERTLTAPPPPPQPAEPPPTEVEKLVKQAKDVDMVYQAQHLLGLGAELTAFTKQRDAALKSYETVFPSLEADWCEQHTLVLELAKQLKGVFNDAERKRLVHQYVCPQLNKMQDTITAVENRRTASIGTLEKALSEAREKENQGKALLAALLDNARVVASALAQVDKWRAEIKDLLAGPKQARAIYVFWFKLAPLHWAVRPERLKDSCAFPEAEDAKALCPSASVLTLPLRVGREHGAWLFDPKCFEAKADAAWIALNSQCGFKKARVLAEAKFKAAPDDLASSEKTRDAQMKGLDEAVQKALEQEKPIDQCCTPAAKKTDEPVAAS